MTRTLRLKDLESAAANNSEQPFFTTGSSGRNGVRDDPPAGDYTPVGILFEENFDDQPDWTSTMHSVESTQEAQRGDILPDNWDKLYQGTIWSPETGHPDKHASMEILASNSDKTRTGIGKSAVFWRESNDSRLFVSDAQTIKLLEQDYDELYVEFWIRFSPNWFQRGDYSGSGSYISKMFRIGAWSGEGGIYSGNDNQVGPRFHWSYGRSSFGVRNNITVMQGPYGASVTGETGNPGGGSKNFVGHTVGMGKNGADPQIPDLVNGGFLINFVGSPVTHESVYGDTEVWTKMGFYVKLNSAPGATDGVLRQWINDEQFWNDTEIAWITDNPDDNPEGIMVGWNYFAIGGNDHMPHFPNADRFEDWWALDDLVVRDSIPEHLI